MKPQKWPDELMFLQNRKAVQHTTTASLQGKTIVLTGATSGVGYMALKRLAQAGAHVVMVVRNEEKAKRVQLEISQSYASPIDYVIADFSNLQEVRNAANQILTRYPTIDILINCTGMHSTTRMHTAAGFETVFCVNHLSSFLFTTLLLDRLKEHTPARILQINSEGHRFNGLDPEDLNWKKPRRYTGLKSYGASKIAQLMTVWELHDQLEGSGVTINAMHPGDVKTHIGSNNGWLYRAFTKLFVSPFLKNASISGEAIYYLVAAPELADVSGKFFHLTIEETPAKHAMNREVGKLIYLESLRMTNERYGK